MHRIRQVFVLCGVLTLAAGAIGAPVYGQDQQVVQPKGRPEATREELKTKVDRLQEQLAATRDAGQQQQLRAQIQALQDRLQSGDFLPGDVIRLDVRGQDTLSGEFVVTEKRNLDLPSIPNPVSLNGVLNSELEATIRDTLATYVRNPQVRAHSLKRVAVLGAVGKPGFYNLPGSTIVSEAVMSAGGPTSNAKVSEIALKRDGQTVREGDRISFNDQTLDQLGVRSGDVLFVPQGGGGISFGAVLGAAGAITSIIYFATRL